MLKSAAKSVRFQKNIARILSTRLPSHDITKNDDFIGLEPLT
jgi:hypothetical protein